MFVRWGRAVPFRSIPITRKKAAATKGTSLGEFATDIQLGKQAKPGKYEQKYISVSFRDCRRSDSLGWLRNNTYLQ
jgi:hypothetical protein